MFGSVFDDDIIQLATIVILAEIPLFETKTNGMLAFTNALFCKLTIR